MKSSTFWDVFICDYLAKHAEADLVTLELRKDKEERIHRLLCLNDIDKITELYCNFKAEKNGRSLMRNPLRRNDNFKKILDLNVKQGRLAKFGYGAHLIDGKKEYLEYDVHDENSWDCLLRNYKDQRTVRMVLWNST